MNIDKHRFLLSFVLLVIFSASNFAQSKPVDVVKSFYKFHNSRNGVLSLHELKLHKRFFTNELYKLFLFELKRQDEFVLKNHNDKPHFGDGLPFKPFEECVVKGKFYNNTYQIEEKSANVTEAIVEVTFYQPKECKEEIIDKYEIELLRTKNTWLINDWIYSDETKLSDDLKRKDY